jgi:hypothetical protein
VVANVWEEPIVSIYKVNMEATGFSESWQPFSALNSNTTQKTTLCIFIAMNIENVKQK